MCWVASLMNREGNEEADKRAKEVATSDRPEYCMHISYTDYYRYIKKSLKERWQNEWNSTQRNKLRAIKQSVNVWQLSSHRSRTEVVLPRLRIGHTRLTHGHLMEGRPPDFCLGCLVPLTVEYILVECPEYLAERRLYLPPRPDLLKILSTKDNALFNAENIIEFLKRIELLDKI